MDVARDIIQARENIKKKYQELRKGRAETRHVLEKAFTPITKPLKEMVDLQQKTVQQPTQQQTQQQQAMAMPISPQILSPYKHLRQIGKTAKEYLDLYTYNPEVVDDLYGPKMSQDGKKFYLGSKEMEFVGNDLLIDGVYFAGSKGLLELVVKKSPKSPTVAEFEIYKKILDLTSAHKENYSPHGQVVQSKGHKYTRIIKKINSGSGLFKTYNPNASVEYRYFDSPNELVDRLRLLLASRESGSSAHENEIIAIFEELRELGLV